jgi:hypothetical protein
MGKAARLGQLDTGLMNGSAYHFVDVSVYLDTRTWLE